MSDPTRHLLMFMPEAWPTYRADIAVLFGKYLPRHGISCDLAAHQAPDTAVPPTAPQPTDSHAGRASGADAANAAGNPSSGGPSATGPTGATHSGAAASSGAADWPGGAAMLAPPSHGASMRYLRNGWHFLGVLRRFDASRYHAIQVRDMPVWAAAALLTARRHGRPLFYWMSYPQSEGQIARARARGPRAGMRYWFPLLQGVVGMWLLYRVVLPRVDHLFVQSERMREDMLVRGVPAARISVVPMGVDLEHADPAAIVPSDDARLAGERVLVYLGTLDRERHIEILFDMLALLHGERPDVLLVLAGDTEDAPHRAWLRARAERSGVASLVLWTGWLPTQHAWRYVRAAEVALSPFPRGPLLDSASPTKAIEYMALGVPVVVNDNPDQARSVQEGGGGLCVALEAGALAAAVLTLLADAPQRAAMGASGRNYVQAERGYDTLARRLAATYQRLLPPTAAPAPAPAQRRGQDHLDNR